MMKEFIAWVFVYFAFMAILIWLWPIGQAHGDELDAGVDDGAAQLLQKMEVNQDRIALERYIDSFLGKMYPKRRKAAISYVPTILSVSDWHKVDPFLISVTISMESSWRSDVTGPGGEFGLGQQMIHHARGCELYSPAGQIES